MVSQDLEAVIHAEGEHVAVVGRHRVVIAAVGTVRVGILGRKCQGIRQQKLDTGGSIESQVGRVTVADGTRTRIIAGNQVYSAIQTDAVRQLQRAVYPETPRFIGVIAGAVVRDVGIHRFVGITDERSEHEPVAQAVV